MAKDLKVGERVRVYGDWENLGVPITGVVVTLEGDFVRVDSRARLHHEWFHVKQCRRLRLKKVRVYVDIAQIKAAYLVLCDNPDVYVSWVFEGELIK